MTDLKSLFIEKEGIVLNVVMQFRIENYRNGTVLVGTDSYRNPKTNMGYHTYTGAMGSVELYSNQCVWNYVGDSYGGRHKGGFESFDEVKKFAVNKFIQVVRSHLKSEHHLKMTREEAKQIRAYLRKGIEGMTKE